MIYHTSFTTVREAFEALPNITTPEVRIKLLRLIAILRNFHNSTHYTWPPVAVDNASRAQRQQRTAGCSDGHFPVKYRHPGDDDDRDNDNNDIIKNSSNINNQARRTSFSSSITRPRIGNSGASPRPATTAVPTLDTAIESVEYKGDCEGCGTPLKSVLYSRREPMLQFTALSSIIFSSIFFPSFHFVSLLFRFPPPPSFCRYVPLLRDASC